MKKNILNDLKFLTEVDISKGISRRFYPKLLALLKTYPKSTYQKTSRGIEASEFGNFWWVRNGYQKYGWERTLRSIIRNFDCVDDTDVCNCETFFERAKRLTRAREQYWVDCFYYKYNARIRKFVPLAKVEEETPTVILVLVDDVIALLVENIVNLRTNTRCFKITNYCFVRDVPSSSYELLEKLMNDKTLREP